MVFHDDVLYAAHRTDNATHTYTYTPPKLNIGPGTWSRKASIKHNFQNVKYGAMLAISAGKLVCGGVKDDVIKVHSLRNGELLHTHGGGGVAHGSNSDVIGQQLYRPFVCDSDDCGNVLIADHKNNRLQVMSEQGVFRVINTDTVVSRPVCAVLMADTLYVASYKERVFKSNKCKLYKYVQQNSVNSPTALSESTEVAIPELM